MAMPDFDYHYRSSRPDIRPHPEWNDNGNLEIRLSGAEREVLDEFRIKSLVESFETSLRAIAHMRQHNQIPDPEQTLMAAHKMLKWMTALEGEVIASGLVSHDRTAMILGVPKPTAQSKRRAMREPRPGDIFRYNIAFRRSDETAQDFYAPKDPGSPDPEQHDEMPASSRPVPAFDHPVAAATDATDPGADADADAAVFPGDVVSAGGTVTVDGLAISAPGTVTVNNVGNDRSFTVRGYTLSINGTPITMTVGEAREVEGWELTATLGGNIIGYRPS